MHPAEDVDLIALDALGAQEDVIRDLARDAENAVDVAEDDVAWTDRHLADADRHLIVRDHAAAERPVRGAVLVEHGELLLENLLRVANAARDDRAADALRDRRRRHDAAPEGRLGVFARVPHDDAVRLEVVQHLRAESHLALDHAVRGGLHAERLAADDHLVAERHDVRRQVLVQKTKLAHHVVDAARVELLVTLAEFLDRNRDLAVRDPLTVRDQLVEFHQSGLFGLRTHVS